MRRLNFYPYYEPLLRSGEKTTTLRIREGDYKSGEVVELTIGWKEKSVQPLHRVEILSAYRKRIAELSADDFLGESPDCQSPITAALVLSAIYRRVVTEQDKVWVVKFKHLR